MESAVRIRVDPEDEGLRLDVALARHVAGLSRSALAALVREGRVTIGGIPVRKAARPLRAGDEVSVAIPAPTAVGIEPDPIPLSVLHEDEDLLVVDKPAGLVVHPAAGHRRGTLVNALVARMGALAPADDPVRLGIVHRLDKDTSGCLAVAKTALARTGLEEQFRDRTVKKVYLAVVHGSPPPAGSVDLAVGRDPRDRKRMSVRSRRGRAAATRFRVLERFAGASLVEVEIATGRTHQIRVHLASLGHPVVGDGLYGGKKGRRGSPLAGFARQALHAAVLAFAHPRTGQPLRFRAPLPPDLEELLRSLRGGG